MGHPAIKRIREIVGGGESNVEAMLQISSALT